MGATPEGRKELVGLTDGARESAHDWRDLLLDLKRRGFEVPPRLARGGRAARPDQLIACPSRPSRDRRAGRCR